MLTSSSPILTSSSPILTPSSPHRILPQDQDVRQENDALLALLNMVGKKQAGEGEGEGLMKAEQPLRHDAGML